MKINIKWPSTESRRQAKMRSLHDWHEKFAWMPTSVDETETTHSIVWMEKYMRRPDRRGSASPPYYIEKKKSRERPRWEKLSAKSYFKKKLNGEFDTLKRDRAEADMAMAASSMNMKAGNGGNVTISAGKGVSVSTGAPTTFTVPPSNSNVGQILKVMTDDDGPRWIWGGKDIS